MVRLGKGSVVRVEVFGDGCAGTSITPRTSSRKPAQEAATDPRELPVDGIAFWLADDAGGGWVLYTAAPKGEMREGAPLWEASFSVQLPA